MWIRSLSLVSILAVCRTLVVPAYAQDHSETFLALAHTCAPSVDPSTLAALVQHESAFDPLAINVNGPDKLPRQPVSVEEAVATAEYLASHGYSFDVGIAQVNSANVRKFNIRWVDVFHPCPNLQAAAAILRDCYARASAGEGDPQIALREALSCYNTGTFDRGQVNGYVRKVEVAAGIAPHVHVPPLLPLKPGQAAKNAAPAAPAAPTDPQTPKSNGLPDAFAQARGDAFDRAALMAAPADAAKTDPATPSAADADADADASKASPVMLKQLSGSHK
ncbi:probable lytic transglycosylase protein (plasmid) [Xanthomonas albilineans]|uniref:Probable lytic transglycosylase protein n=2 Tax=Xanthomonas albilineans TaxID=29447 RepID=D6CKC0_XANAP|nr:probable lytic transglycosylase protein [Xanthomonas albilineans]